MALRRLTFRLNRFVTTGLPSAAHDATQHGAQGMLACQGQLLGVSPTLSPGVDARRLHSAAADSGGAAAAYDDRAFNFLLSERAPKQHGRTNGLTEVRGPSSGLFGKNYAQDLFNAMGPAIDGLQFGSGCLRAMQRAAVLDVIDVAHSHGAYMSTGRDLEWVLPKGREAVQQYFREARNMGFDVIQFWCGARSMPADEAVRVVWDIKQAGLKAHVGVNIQLGIGADGTQAAMTRPIATAQRALDAGADLIKVVSKSIRANEFAPMLQAVDVTIQKLGPDKVMFGAADVTMLRWYVQTLGAEVNLVVDHGLITQAEAFRDDCGAGSRVSQPQGDPQKSE